jgi:hypothetical protein
MSERTLNFFGDVLVAGMHAGDTCFLVCMEFLFNWGPTVWLG